MVSSITEGTAFDRHGRPFRRRNYVPGLLTIGALAVVALMTFVPGAAPLAVPVFWALVALSSVSSHAPKNVRHWWPWGPDPRAR